MYSTVQADDHAVTHGEGALGAQPPTSERPLPRARKTLNTLGDFNDSGK